MTPAQNRALRVVLLNHMRQLDRFIIYLETAPGVRLKDTIFEAIRRDTSYRRASIRAAIHQLEDQYVRSNPDSGRDRRAGFPAAVSSNLRPEV